MAVPSTSLLLLSGIPATGKSTFGRYLASEHGFAHYDLECHPQGWPHPDLKATWDASRPAFVAGLRQRHNRIVLDWGFPVHCVSLVEQLRVEGMQLIWFDGNRDRARSNFQQRESTDAVAFDQQVAAIDAAGYPKSLDCTIVDALPADGCVLEPARIVQLVFS